MLQKTVNVYLISDSSGETVSVVFRAASAQLPEVKIIDHISPLVRTNVQIDEIIHDIIKNNGIVMCTMADQDLLKYLQSECKKHKIPCIEVLTKIIKEMANYFKTVISYDGRQFNLEDENFYSERIEAINYTITHDDGQSLLSANQADIIIVGISRTSKTPTSIYLANRGYKVANIPIIPGIGQKIDESLLKNKFVIALTISPERLVRIRKQRLQHIYNNAHINYVDNDQIAYEVEQALMLYRQYNWPMIDVTDRSIEEASAIIIQYYNRFLKKE